MVCMRDKTKRIDRMSVDAGALREYAVKTPMTPDHIATRMRSSGLAQVGIGRSS